MPKKKSHLNVHYAMYKNIALGFFGISLILFLVIFYFTYRKAVIKIKADARVVSDEFIVDVKEPDAGADTLNGRIMQETLNDELEYNTQSEVDETIDGVTAEISIINNNNRPQVLVATTRFLTDDGILFRLKNRVNAPAKSNISAQIYADNPEEIKNEIKPADFKIPGLSESFQEKIYGKTFSSIYPATKKVKIIAASDIDNAKAEILDNLSKKAIMEFAKNVKSGEKILSKAISKETLNFEMDKKEGDKSASFNVKMNVKFTAVIFNEDELFELAKNKLAQISGKGYQLSGLSRDKLMYSVEKYDLAGGTANIRTMLAGKAVINGENEILDKENMVNLAKNDVIARLKLFKEVKDVEIKVSPSWCERLPRMKNSIEIIVEE